MIYTRDLLEQNEKSFFEKIKNKTIVFIGHSPELKNNILPKGNDYIYGSLNNYSLIKDKLENDTNKKLDFVYCTSTVRFEENIVNFNREKNLFPIITNYDCLYNFVDRLIPIHPIILNKYENHSLNSLSVCLYTLLFYQPKEIRLYGFSGFAEDEVYYNQHLLNEKFLERKQTIFRDTETMNILFWDTFKYSIKNKHPELEPNIINYTKHSKITCFPFAEEL